jgi:3',5'-cyclic-AMP phosphodiesterase
MTLIAQLSDPHITAPGRRLMEEVDTARHLRSALAALMRLKPLPDALIISGDLVESGQPEQYAHLRAMLSRVPMPIWLLPGNHDDPAVLNTCLRPAGWLGQAAETGYLDYTVDIGPLRLVALDSTVAGQPHGELAPAQLDWLDSVLAEHPAQPTLVALHHPPFDSGIRFMDSMALSVGREALEDIVSRHRQVERVLSGHVHRCITRRFAGTMAMTAPSTAHQMALDLRADGGGGYTLEPAGGLLHHWNGQALTSHHWPTGRKRPAVPFD